MAESKDPIGFLNPSPTAQSLISQNTEQQGFLNLRKYRQHDFHLHAVINNYINNKQYYYESCYIGSGHRKLLQTHTIL